MLPNIRAVGGIIITPNVKVDAPAKYGANECVAPRSKKHSTQQLVFAKHFKTFALNNEPFTPSTIDTRLGTASTLNPLATTLKLCPLT